MLNAWILFHSELANAPHEAEECLRLQEEGYKQGVSFKILAQSQFELLIDNKGEWQAFYQGQVLDRPDFIMVRSGADTNYAGFAVLRFYEQLGVPLYNTRRAVERSGDKLYAQKVLGNAGIPMPKTMMARNPTDIELVEREIGFPVVVKVINGTCGKGILLAESAQQLRDITDLLAQIGGGTQLLFQKYVNASHGRDLRVLVIDGRVRACMERRSADGGFKSNISLGGRGFVHAVTPEIEEIALKAASVLELSVAGVDLLVDENSYKICEVNSAPGFCGDDGMEKTCGVNIPALIVESAARHHREPKGIWDRVKAYADTIRAA